MRTVFRDSPLSMKTPLRPFAPILFSFVLIAAGASGAEPTKPGKPPVVVAPTEKKRVITNIESAAPADFPFNFQSVFGAGDKAMAGLREKSTGRSLWANKGDKFSGYTLETVDAAKGLAVFSKGGVRYQLKLSASTHSPAPVAPVAQVDPVQNARKEKVLINDARMLSSAFQQYCSEHAVESVELGKLRQFFSSGTLSPGTQIDLGGGRFVDFSDRSADSLVLNMQGGVSLMSEGYDKSASQNRSIIPEGRNAKDTPGGEQAIGFRMGDGQPVK
jgi:hypothetical protein